MSGKVFATDQQLLTRVLRPYRKNCGYMRSARLVADGDPVAGGRITVHGELSIPESCYIDDTGHFNSVEFNICYKQLIYYAVAKSVQEKLMASFARWSRQRYWQRQLTDFLITAPTVLTGPAA